ncbi:MAG: class I SAM-dependent methyltransferase [Phenylobacterium sp.]
MSDPKPILIFPAGYGDGPARRELALAFGLEVIGGSSLDVDPEQARYERWVRLPHVSDPGFDAALKTALAEHGVGRIHASHYAVWHHLKSVLPDIAPNVVLTVGRNNFDLQADYQALSAKVANAPAIPELGQASPPRPAPHPVETAGWLRAAMAIPGESYEPKLLALMEVCRRAPAGDIVEIGCLFGRTAALLAMMAERYDLGAVLCVDPWTTQSSEQGNAQLEAASQGFDWSSFRQIFEINVAPFARGRLNYIHGFSMDGARAYGARRDVETEVFGRTRYEGAIGLLHIDGNHEYEHVLADAEAWTPRVKPGGWIIFDDYDWDWGDGPRRVADAWLKDHAARISASFLAGGAMFVQLRP